MLNPIRISDLLKAGVALEEDESTYRGQRWTTSRFWNGAFVERGGAVRTPQKSAGGSSREGGGGRGCDGDCDGGCKGGACGAGTSGAAYASNSIGVGEIEPPERPDEEEKHRPTFEDGSMYDPSGGWTIERLQAAAAADDYNVVSGGATRSDCQEEDGYYFDSPVRSAWGSDCHLASSDSDCNFVRPLIRESTCSSFECPDDDWRDYVIVRSCDSPFEALFGLAWCMLIDNSDIVKWATCRVFGEDWTYDLFYKLFGMTSERGVVTGPRLRVELTCDYGQISATWASPCRTDNVALSFFDHAGGWTNVCIHDNTVRRWAYLFESDCEADRLCALIDCAAILAHELTHIVFTFRAGDSVPRDCEVSYLFGNMMRWALLWRYPQAMTSGCCIEWLGENGLPVDSLFANDGVDQISSAAEECVACYEP